MADRWKHRISCYFKTSFELVFHCRWTHTHKLIKLMRVFFKFYGFSFTSCPTFFSSFLAGSVFRRQVQCVRKTLLLAIDEFFIYRWQTACFVVSSWCCPQWPNRSTLSLKRKGNQFVFQKVLLIRSHTSRCVMNVWCAGCHNFSLVTRFAFSFCAFSITHFVLFFQSALLICLGLFFLVKFCWLSSCFLHRLQSSLSCFFRWFLTSNGSWCNFWKAYG